MNWLNVLCLSLLACAITGFTANRSDAQINQVLTWEYAEELPGVALNETGTVAFSVLSAGDGIQQGVYRGDQSGLIQQLSTPPFSGLSNHVAINDSGQLCFWAADTNGIHHIYLATGDVLASRAESTGEFAGHQFLRMPALNNQGTVAFSSADYSVDEVGVYRVGQDGLTTIIERTQGFLTAQNPDINDSGVVAFYWRYLDGSPSAYEIYVSDGLGYESRVRMTSSLSFVYRPNTLQINEQSDVVGRFAGFFFGDDRLVFGDGETQQILVNESGPYYVVGGGGTTEAQSSWNNLGLFAFRAREDTNGNSIYGLFWGPDPSEDAIVRVGDPLSGSRVVALSLNRWGLNDAGRIAFSARLENGKTGIYIADRCGGLVQVYRGRFVAGPEWHLEKSDNLDMSFRPNGLSVTSYVEVDIKAKTDPAEVKSLEFILECSVFARTQVEQTISFRNFDTGSYEVIDQRPSSRFVDESVRVSPTGDLSRFVDDQTGGVKARIRFQSDSDRRRFSANVDQAVWVVN